MEYILERLVDGVWYAWGRYEDPVKLAKAAFALGRYGYEQIRIIPMEGRKGGREEAGL